MSKIPGPAATHQEHSRRPAGPSFEGRYSSRLCCATFEASDTRHHFSSPDRPRSKDKAERSVERWLRNWI